MRETFEEKYQKKLAEKVEVVEFSGPSLNEFIEDTKNGVDHKEDLKKNDSLIDIYNEILKETIKKNNLHYLYEENGGITDSFKSFFKDYVKEYNLTQMGPEELKYIIWFEDQVKNQGLTSIHVSYNENAINTNKEEICKELNMINEAYNKGLCTEIKEDF